MENSIPASRAYLGIPPAKKHFSDYILTKVTVYHEKQIRAAASSNCKMKFLNVSIIGLSGRLHSALSGVITSQDVTRMRPHIKMLCCDLYTYEQKAKQQGGSPHCRLCQEDSDDDDNNSETIQHILTSCFIYKESRTRIFEQMEAVCRLSESGLDFGRIKENQTKLSQFNLDCITINL